MKLRPSLIALLAVAGCSAHSPKTRSSTIAAASGAGGSASAPATSARLPDGPDVARGVLGWALVEDSGPLLRTVARVGGLPASGAATEGAARILLARAAGLSPRAADGLDLTRPTAVALLDPSLSSGGGALPVVALVPIRGRAELEAGLRAAGVALEPQPWGLAAATRRGKLFIAIRDGWAMCAGRPELLRAAWQALEPVVARGHDPASNTALTIHLDARNVYASFGAQLEILLGRFAAATRGSSDPQLAFALRSARRLARYADSMQSVELLVGVDDAGIELTARVDGKPGSAWADFVAAQHPGPMWGLGLLPKDAVLVYATHRSGDTAQEELDAAVDYLGDASVPPASAGSRASWREALARVVAEMPGEVVYGVWPGGDGGVGVGGAYRVRAGEGARREALAAYRRIGEHMAGVVARALRLDPARFKLNVVVREGAMRVASVRADTVEIDVRWPRGADAERRRFRTLFGNRLVMATAFVGEQAVFAVGHDVRGRLAAMVDAASGRASPSLANDPRFRNALGFHSDSRVSLSWLSTAGMADFIGRTLRENGLLGPGQLDALGPVLVDAGDGAIVTTTNARGLRYELSTRLPTSSLPGLPRIGAILWRIALSPLLNPPTMPPLPIPPAHVTPSGGEPAAPVRPRRNASSNSNQLL